jgi:hypothetical protein
MELIFTKTSLTPIRKPEEKHKGTHPPAGEEKMLSLASRTLRISVEPSTARTRTVYFPFKAGIGWI